MILKVKEVNVEVDPEDYEWLSKLNWTISRQPNGSIYLQHWKKGKCSYMHRMILEAPKGRYVDHINMCTTDNRRSNLRLCDHSLNMRNTNLRSNNTSGYRGVYEYKDGRKKKWKAEGKLPSKTSKHLGGFYSKVLAAKAYDTFMVKTYPEFNHFNFPDDIV